MTVTSLTSHNEKVATLRDFLNFAQQKDCCSCSTAVLTIMGQGGSGKSSVLKEVVETSSIPILVLEDDNMQYFPGKAPNSKQCAVIYTCLGLPDNSKMPEYFRSNIVEFKPDPAMPPSSTVSNDKHNYECPEGGYEDCDCDHCVINREDSKEAI